ncbi:hypothetical protein [Hymenobacter sp. UYCo722]|uniref:hypothetical protein n=1 Tax=Hymenobacter sp. UYCo722 TaxID=3156335 RepID=UPI003397BE9B
MLGGYFSTPVYGQSSYAGAPGAVIGLVRMIADQKKANDAILARTTTTTTYRGQSLVMKRCPEDVVAGDAADRITQLETQLGLCHTALLADSTSRTCPPELEAAIRANLNYIGSARPGWSLQTYRQELKFYLTEDKRRQHAATSATAK